MTAKTDWENIYLPGMTNEETIRYLYNEKWMSVSKMALKLGVCELPLYKRMDELGIKRRQPKQFCDSEILSLLKKRIKEIRSTYKSLTDEQIRKKIKFTELAKEIGCTDGLVRHYWKKGRLL